MRLAVRFVTIALVVGMAGACKKGSSGDAPGSGKGKVTKSATPKVHRASAQTCSDAPRSTPKTAKSAGDCKAHADCTGGKNGLCLDKYIGQGEYKAECAYDQCTSDADCKEGPCVCGDDVNHVCPGGGCRTDADCAGSFCSPTLDDCGWDYMPKTWYCHTSGDECTNDEDCGAGAWCGHDAKSNSWKCRDQRCQD